MIAKIQIATVEDLVNGKIPEVPLPPSVVSIPQVIGLKRQDCIPVHARQPFRATGA